MQVVPVAGKSASSLNDQIIASCNFLRAQKGLPGLKSSSKIQQVLKQWATSLKNKMNLTKYISLYGIHYFQIYLFSPIPTQYAPQVVARLGKAIVSPSYTNFAITNYTSDNQNYEIYLVLEGGDDALQQKFTKQEINKIINEIESRKKIEKNIINSTPVKI